MELELVAKIRKTLEVGVETEQAVVYLLVKIRKLCDKTNYNDAALRTFCNWVVHTDLSKRADGSTYILREIDNEIDRCRTEGFTLASSPIFHFTPFQESLRRFFLTFKLPSELVSTKAKWRPFIMLYSTIISECPLVFKASKMPLQYIETAELCRRAVTIVVNGIIVPRLKWKLKFKDGGKQEITTWGDKFTIFWTPKRPTTFALPSHSSPQTPPRD
jgi:hypothetical protein